jgi:hypothetical protein
LEAQPQTESYSLQLNVSNGNYYVLKDNIVVQSVMHDRMPLEERVAKLEIEDGNSTTYDYQDNIISTIPVGDLATDVLQGIQGMVLPSPVNLDSLNAQGVAYSVNGNTITIFNLISQGDDTNSNLLLTLSTGLPLLEMFYDDNNPSKLTTMAAHQYSSTNALQTSTFTYFDYLDDGDVRKKLERWTYSNYSLTIQ